jgi:hypothetical protein
MESQSLAPCMGHDMETQASMDNEEMFAVTSHELEASDEESNRIDGGSLQTDGKTMETGGRVIAVKTRFAAT